MSRIQAPIGRCNSEPCYHSAQSIGYFGVPEIRALFQATYFAGLRKAGMPEG